MSDLVVSSSASLQIRLVRPSWGFTLQAIDGGESRAEHLKRLRDVVICLALLPLALPIGALMALLIKLESPGPVLVSRDRCGRGGRAFRLWRFRTRAANDWLGRTRPSPPVLYSERRENACPLTATGRLLRATGLVHLPQLLNVLSGEMALVGPRPRRPRSGRKLWHTAPLEVRPGMTGPWRVAEDELDRDAQTRLEIGYLRMQSTWLDLRILLATVGVILAGTRYLVKRGLDVVVAASLLILLAPVMLALAVAVKRSSPGPVLFRQLRVGKDGHPFHIVKFRTMRSDAEAVLRADPELYATYLDNDFKLPLHTDPRITRLGVWLRRTSLDELPQLWNVLRGDMSLVGPRPVVPDEVAYYGERARKFLSVLPGVTGLWQVCGRSDLHYPERCEVELDYVRTWSLTRDVVILYRTVGAVVSGRGAT